MLRVPTLDAPQVAPNALPTPMISAPTMPDIAGQQAQQLGQAVQRAGTRAADFAIDLEREANQLRVDEALNRIKEQALRLTYDQNEGYLNLKGANAFERPKGKSLDQEYAERLQQSITEVVSGLGNDAQRMMVTQAAQGILTNFRGQILKHESDEYKTYALSVAEGVQATAMREIALSWNNPEAIDAAIARIKAQTYRQSQLLGKSAEWQEAQARNLTSAAHALAVSTALEHNDVIYADMYLQKYGGQMQADDLLKVRGQITKAMDIQVGENIGAEVFAQFVPRVAPSDYARLTNIVMQLESGGRRYDAQGYGARADGSQKGTGWLGELKMKDGSGAVATEISISVEIDGREVEIPTLVPTLSQSEIDHLLNGGDPTDAIVDKAVSHARKRLAVGASPFANDGKLLTSPKGAKGEMQVMDATNTDPGFGVKPAKDDSPEERARVGRDYLAAMVKRYNGEVDKALAAYNWGPGNVDAAIKQHGANWLAHAPRETRDYVARGVSAFGAGDGKPPRPTLAEMREALRARPELADNPARLKVAEARLAADYKAMTDAIKQREEEVLDEAYRALFANGGDLGKVPASLRAAIPGDKLGSLIEFARKVPSAGHSAEAWAEVMTLPPEELARMTPSEFYRRFRPVLDDAHLEKGYALIESARNVASEKHLEIITVDQRMKQAAIGAGIIPADEKPNEEQIKQFAQFQTVIDQRVRQFERTDLGGKRKATTEELQRIIDQTLMDKAFVPRWYWADKEQPIALLSPEDQARAYVTVNGEEVPLAAIPIEQRTLIASKLRARGLPVTEQAIADLWVRAGKPK